MAVKNRKKADLDPRKVGSTEVQFVLQTRGPSHIDQVMETLEKAGIAARIQRGVHP